MSRGRAPFTHGLLLGAVAAATTWGALTSWRGFLTDPSDYLVPLLVCGTIIAVTGAALRRFDVPAVAVIGAQLVVVSAYLGEYLVDSPVPRTETFDALVVVLGDAIESARTYAAPIGPDAPSVAPLLLVSGTFFMLLVDLLGCTLRRVPVAGLGLLAIYSVPAGLTDTGPGWIAFLGAAVGFLVLLHLDARDQLLHWGRPLGPAGASPWSDANPLTDALRAGAGRIGAVATALALVVPLFLPVLDIDLLGLGPGDGDNEIRIRKPIADMRGDLERGADIPMLRVTTDDPHPDYLRISVLNRFTGVEWSSGDRDVSSEDRADGAIPEPQGLSPDVPRREYEYDVAVSGDFDSTWLPTQFPAGAVEAEGDWRFDEDTMDFLAADDDLNTTGLSYSMTALEPEYGTEGTYFQNALDEEVDEEVLNVPGGLPSEVRSFAYDESRGARDDYERALLLQRAFRTKFTYDLNGAPDGTGGAAFETFLNEGPNGRVGYCEQFASAMAIMARILGIPARVAIGFLEPDPLGDGVYEYSSHDLHAWPELYFAGAGWVRFEPTPSGRAENVPAYSRVRVRNGGIDVPGGGTEADPTDTRGQTDRPTGAVTSQAPDRADDATGGGADEGTDWSTVVVVAASAVGALALLVVLALAPRSTRARVRRRRLAGGPDAVWDEIRATALDLGVPWPDGRSPREAGAVITDHLGDRFDPAPPERPHHGADVDPDATEALRRVVERVERCRYARPGSAETGPTDALTLDAEVTLAALEAGAARQARNRAAWFPRSLWGGGPSSSSPAGAEAGRV